MGKRAQMSRLTTNQRNSISVKFLKNNLYFCKGGSGGMKWTDAKGAETGSIGFLVSMVAGTEHIRFAYLRIDPFSGEKLYLDYTVRLSSTPCHFGGRRWWFCCPFVEDGKACNRRVGILYLGVGKYFGCRHCLNLTYQSSKDSHRFDDIAQRMGFADYKTFKKLPSGLKCASRKGQ